MNGVSWVFKRSDIRNGLIALALVLTTVLLYLPVRGYDFVNYDDYRFVTGNPHLQEGVTRESVYWALTAGWGGNLSHADYWRPVSYLSHALDVELFGMNAGGHHMMSVGIHAAAAAALFWVLLALTGAPWQSVFVAALFAFHPLRVESVAWIAERKDVLSGLFFFLTIGAYVRYARRPFSLSRYLTVLFLFLLAVMSKPMMVTVPCVLLLLDFWPLERAWGGQNTEDRGQGAEKISPQSFPCTRTLCGRNVRLLVIEKIPLFALSGIISVGTFIASRDIGAVIEKVPVALRIGNALTSCATYIGKTFWPFNLTVLYPYGSALPVWKVTLASAVLLGITILAFRGIRKRPYLAVGWLWYTGMLLPVSGLLVQAGSQALADRYTYVPTIGLYIMAAWGLPDLMKHWKWRRGALSMLAMIILTACIWATLRQLPVWQNSTTLFEQALNTGRESWIVHNNLGLELSEQNRFEEAVVSFDRAIKIDPSHAMVRHNRALMLAQLGRFKEAFAEWNVAFSLPVQSKQNRGIMALTRGCVFEQTGNLDAAEKDYTCVADDATMDPIQRSAALQLRAALFIKIGCREKAEADLLEILKLPDTANSYHEKARRALDEKAVAQ
ncbi:MAG: tetratricopeptide repeat protein [Kiritimatiellales bacterium]